MTFFMNIAKKWVNNTISKSEVDIMKKRVFEVCPSWSFSSQINIIDNPDNVSFIIISLNEYGVNRYDYILLKPNDVFVVEVGLYDRILPCSFVIEHLYVKNTDGYSVHMVFGKHTGLSFMHYAIGKENYGGLEDASIYASNDDYYKSIEFMKTQDDWINTPETEDNCKNVKYLFTDDKFLEREENWYLHNKYKEYEELGILSDYSVTIPSGWTVQTDDEYIPLFGENELISYDLFLKHMELFHEPLYTEEGLNEELINKYKFKGQSTIL